MTNLSTAIRYLPDASPNPDLIDLTAEFKHRDNAAFLSEVAKRLAETSPDGHGRGFDSGGVACIGLIGEYGRLGYGMRRAQEVLRVDGTPSYWSQAFLFHETLSLDAAINRSPKSSAWIWECSLEPADVSARFADRNGVGVRRIAEYAQARFHPLAAHVVPNIAVLAIALTEDERKAIMARARDVDVDQLRYDLLGLLGTWYGHLTSRGATLNPLVQGHAMFSAAYVQLAYDAAGIDLAPGSHQRNVAPEHFWQAVSYLGQTFRASVPDSPELAERAVAGWWCARDPACLVMPTDEGWKMPKSLADLTTGATEGVEKRERTH